MLLRRFHGVRKVSASRLAETSQIVCMAAHLAHSTSAPFITCVNGASVSRGGVSLALPQEPHGIGPSPG